MSKWVDCVEDNICICLSMNRELARFEDSKHRFWAQDFRLLRIAARGSQ